MFGKHTPLMGSFVRIMVVLFALGVCSEAGDVWRAGDVLVGINGGQFQILRPNGTGKSSFTIVDTLTDSTSNSTAGCALDSTWRPHLTSFGTTSSLLERVQIGDIGTSHPIVANVDTSTSGGLGGKVVALDAQGFLYVGHSGGNGMINVYSPPAVGQKFSGVPLPFRPVTTIQPPQSNVSEGLDISSVAQTTPNQANEHPNYTNYLYFTSGLNIFVATFNLSFNPGLNTYQLTTPTIQLVTINYNGFNLPPGFAYHGIRIVADANNNPTSLVAAAGAKIVQLTLDTVSSAHLSVVYDSTGKKANWQVLTLDPCAGVAGCTTYAPLGSSFWAGDQANNRLVHFTMPTIPPSGFVTQGLDFFYGLSTTPNGVCEVGGIGAAQPRPNAQTVTLLNTPAGSTFTFNVPLEFPTTFYIPNQTSQNTFTVGANFTTGQSLATRLFSVDYDPISGAGTGDDGSACLTTAPPPPLGVVSPYCEAYKLELTPNPGQGYSFVDLDLFTLQQTTSADATPPANPGPEPVGTNPKFYHDGKIDDTIALFQDETRIKSGGGSTLFSIQNQIAAEGLSCGYLTPIVPNGVYNLGQNLDFKFQAVSFSTVVAAGSVSQACAKGPFITNLLPRLTLVLLNPNNLNSSTQEPVNTQGCSNQCFSPYFNPPVGQGSTWELQVDTTGLPAGTYIATTIDDTGNITEFSTIITLQ